MRKGIIAGMIALPLSAVAVRAHCPLCTIGAAAAAGGAAALGVGSTAIGIFIGGFAASTGWWLAKAVKRQFIPKQREVLIIASFLMTVLPMLPLLGSTDSIGVYLFGGYGTLLNRTYVFDGFLIGSIIGALVLFATPWLSKKLTSLRNGRQVPYQGVMLTISLLVVLGALMQWWFP